MSEDLRPTVIFRGNCQAHHMAAILGGADLCTTYVEGTDYGFIPAFRSTLVRFIELPQSIEIIRRAREDGRRVIVAQQATPLVDADMSEYESLVDEIIRFPFLQFNAGARKQYADPASALKRLRRLYMTDLDMMRLSQDKSRSAFDFAAYIEREHPEKPLFHATTHPGPALTSLLFRVIADQILPNHPAIGSVQDELAAGEGLNFMSDLYLPPEGREILGFEWSGVYDLYYEMPEAMDKTNWEWIEENIEVLKQHFSTDTLFIYHHVRYLLAQSRPGEVRPLIAEMLRREPGCSWFWHLGLEASAFDGADEVRAIVGRATAVLESARIGPQILAGMRTRAGELGIEV